MAKVYMLNTMNVNVNLTVNNPQAYFIRGTYNKQPYPPYIESAQRVNASGTDKNEFFNGVNTLILNTDNGSKTYKLKMPDTSSNPPVTVQDDLILYCFSNFIILLNTDGFIIDDCIIEPEF